MKIPEYILPVILVMLLFITSCREEIIPPGNFAGNINEPVKLNSATNYSFIINAEDISTELIDHTIIYTLKSSCYVSILDYQSGNVEITVSGETNEILFQRMFAGNTPSSFVILEGSSPTFVQIKLINFTGKLKFELNKL